MMGLAQPSPTLRAAALSVIAALAFSHPDVVRGLLPRLAEVAEDPDATPDVQMSLLETAVTLLGNTLVACPSAARHQAFNEEENGDDDDSLALAVATATACIDVMSSTLAGGVGAPTARRFLTLAEPHLASSQTLVALWVDAALSLPADVLAAAVEIDLSNRVIIASASPSGSASTEPPLNLGPQWPGAEIAAALAASILREGLQRAGAAHFVLLLSALTADTRGTLSLDFLDPVRALAVSGAHKGSNREQWGNLLFACMS